MSVPFIRIFGDEKIDLEHNIDNHENSKLCINGRCFFIKDITSFYFNGGDLNYEIVQIRNTKLNKQFSQSLNKELSTLYSHLFYNIEKAKHFGLPPFINKSHNKLNILKTARKCGLSIPQSVIITGKDALIKYKNEWKRIITKNLYEGINISTNKIILNSQRTEEVTEKEIKKMKSTFFPSLIQELIHKKFEIRVFYFRARFYSIAIFSQNNQETQIDFRRPTKKITRMVPYELPNTIKIKIIKLMSTLNLNYGSIDLIYDIKSKYYFLEVNPYGQFGFVSTLGNFYIEKEIANYLK